MIKEFEELLTSKIVEPLIFLDDLFGGISDEFELVKMFEQVLSVLDPLCTNDTIQCTECTNDHGLDLINVYSIQVVDCYIMLCCVLSILCSCEIGRRELMLLL